MKSILLLAGLAAGALALPPSHGTQVLHQKRTAAHEALFAKRSAVDANTTIPLRIALKQGNIEEAQKRLADISNPNSPNYGKHLSRAEVVNMFAVDDANIAAVKSWLGSHGVDRDDIHVSPTKTWMRVNAPANLLEKALQARYHIYRRRDADADDHLGLEHYSLPSQLSGIIDYIQPGTRTAKVRRAAAAVAVPGRKAGSNPNAIREPLRQLSADDVHKIEAAARGNGSSALDDCDTHVTPECIAHLYRIPPAPDTNISNNRLGMFESLDDVYAQEDLDLFFQNVVPRIPAGTGPKLSLINGATAPNPPDNSGGESMLDFEMAYPIIYPQGIELFQVRTDEYDNIFGDFLSAVDADYCATDPFFNKHKMCGLFEPTTVVSISYGGEESPTDVEYAHRTCNEMMKLGLIGVTVVASSGDAGVANRANMCYGAHHDIFVPDDLGGCPYVTSVGSTLLKAIDKPEVATESFSSGGGFSNIFPRPDWQDAAVSHYLLRHNPGYFAYNVTEGRIPDGSSGSSTDGVYNRGGRGYPDVAALGDNGVVAVGGEMRLSGGTSMSAPIVAAILNRVNEKRLSLGKGPVGFVNPALYDMYTKTIIHNKKMEKRGFNDVTVGNQSLGGAWSDRGYSACGNIGFSCVEGWDPVTGLGSPVYPVWEDYFLKL